MGCTTHTGVTGFAINAGLGESGLSEKGEKAEIRVLLDDGGLRDERMAIIVATHATVTNVGTRVAQTTRQPAAKKDISGAARGWRRKQTRSDVCHAPVRPICMQLRCKIDAGR